MLSIFTLHLSGPFPDLAGRPAAEVKAEELRDVLARLIEAGKGRTAAKRRAYLRAAPGMAMRAGLDPTLPEALTAFDTQADRLPSLAQLSKAMDRLLTLPELHAFWRDLEAAPESPSRDGLMACTCFGGQRPAQLLRLTPQQVDVSGATLTLPDPKGRNRHANPRRHMMPILDEPMLAIRRRLAQAEDADSPMFSTNGRVPLRKETVAPLVTETAKAMKKAGELERGPFSMRDLRRTAEMHMAALGISSDVRAQIQSHGSDGIQARHHDRQDCMPEKRAALEMWSIRFRNLSKRSQRTAPVRRTGRGSKQVGTAPAIRVHAFGSFQVQRRLRSPVSTGSNPLARFVLLMRGANFGKGNGVPVAELRTALEVVAPPGAGQSQLCWTSNSRSRPSVDVLRVQLGRIPIGLPSPVAEAASDRSPTSARAERWRRRCRLAVSARSPRAPHANGSVPGRPLAGVAHTITLARAGGRPSFEVGGGEPGLAHLLRSIQALHRAVRSSAPTLQRIADAHHRRGGMAA